MPSKSLSSWSESLSEIITSFLIIDWGDFTSRRKNLSNRKRLRQRASDRKCSDSNTLLKSNESERTWRFERGEICSMSVDVPREERQVMNEKIKINDWSWRNSLIDLAIVFTSYSSNS